MSQVIRCRCQGDNGNRNAIVAVLNDDGSVEKHVEGKALRFSGHGTAELSCKRCGFRSLITLDNAHKAVVA